MCCGALQSSTRSHPASSASRTRSAGVPATEAPAMLKSSEITAPLKPSSPRRYCEIHQLDRLAGRESTAGKHTCATMTPAKPFAGAPATLFRRPDLVRGVYDVHPDGTRFLIAAAVVAERDLPLTVSLGWRSELERR